MRILPLLFFYLFLLALVVVTMAVFRGTFGPAAFVVPAVLGVLLYGVTKIVASAPRPD